MRSGPLVMIAASILLCVITPSLGDPSPLPGRDAKSHIVDQASVLSPPLRGALDELLLLHEQATGEEVVLGILSARKSEAGADPGRQIYREWKIGRRSRDTGVLLLLFWGDRKPILEVGSGLESTLPVEETLSRLESILDVELPARNPDRSLSLSALEILSGLQSPLVENGKAQDLLKNAGLTGAWTSTQEPVQRYEWLGAVGALAGLLLAGAALYLLTSADAHYTSAGWYRARPWRSWGKRADLSNLGGAAGRW